MRLIEHEVVSGHHSARRIQRQGRADVVTKLKRRRLKVVGRRQLGKVREQNFVAVRVCVAVGERHVMTVDLTTIMYKIDSLTD